MRPAALYPLSFALGAVLVATTAPAVQKAEFSREVLELRNLAIAQLENERPAEAEATLRRLAPRTPRDPLAEADLAVALLRQQKTAEALAASERALRLEPGRPDLLLLRGEILEWSGRPEEALTAYNAAAQAGPDDAMIQQALYRQAQGLGAAAEADLDRALAALRRLRPENLVVLLQAGGRAAQAGRREEATAALLRLREILEPAPEAASALDAVRLALERADLAQTRVAFVRLENQLKAGPLYQSALGELGTGLVGTPVERFVDEPPATQFGEPLDVRFAAAQIAEGSVTALVTGDFVGDERPEIASASGGAIELRAGAAGGPPAASWPSGALGGERHAALAAIDLDNDGRLDLLGSSSSATVYWRNAGDGRFADASAEWGLAVAPLRSPAVAVLDADLEGDLDLVAMAGTENALRLETRRNRLAPPLAVESAPGAAALDVGALVAADLDRDGDLDLLAAGSRGMSWFENRRAAGFGPGVRIDSAATVSVAVADLDEDGDLDILQATDRLRVWTNAERGFRPAAGRGLESVRAAAALVAFDADNDGRLDVAAAGPFGVRVLGAVGDGSFVERATTGLRGGATALAAADLDQDGDLDLVAGGPAGLWRLENVGPPRHHWLRVRLQGLTKGNGKNNRFGLGATIEVRAGAAYQFRPVSSDVTHLGLGTHRTADSVRVVWTNGVPQHRLQPAADQRIVEEQVLKGSCPFLFAWDGERVRFVTDLLWGAPIGLPVAPGVWAGADSDELVHVPDAEPRGGVYDLRITEELWEAAYFDRVRLWVIDHPEEVEVASSLRVVPGAVVAEEVRASRDLRAPAAARDGRGEDATDRVRRRDDVYAGGYPIGDYQGAAPEPWTLEFDLGRAPAGPVRLHLDGWIFPADASLNLAISQRGDLGPIGPLLEMQHDGAWSPLVEFLGLPAGKTKTMVIDTPPLPAGVRRLRIRSNLWLAWDRIAWTEVPADSQASVRAVLSPETASLEFRGFSEITRRAPNAPHEADYARVSRTSPWLPFPGRYTRFGDVRPLLAERDSQLVILAAGDELRLTFDSATVPDLAAGWRRTVFLESSGWDKDADRNTAWVDSADPLPFQGMRAYPYAPGEGYPDDPALREYAARWLTRRVPPAR